MKKFLFGLFLLIASPAYAGIISLNTISADSTPSTFNNNFSSISGAINGNIQGSATTGSSTNILAASIGQLDMGNEANPRVRDSELLGITVDSTTVQGTFVYSGCTPATDVTLTSSISACTAYVNGYRVSKGATTQTYTASMDTYVDLSQTGSYTLSPVAVGGTAPSVAANSARLAKVTTSGTAITSVTDLANRRLGGLVTPTNYRSGLLVSRDSTGTLTVFPGLCEINNAMVAKTSTTTLTLATAGDWAGGSSLQATSTYGYVGIDASGNLKMHTTAPTSQNYALTVTAGKKRYATWSSTVYRILGWFYMNASGSGQLNSYEVGNIKEADVPNTTMLTSGTSVNSGSTTFATDAQALSHFYSSGNPVQATYNSALGESGTSNIFATLSIDSAGIAENYSGSAGSSGTTSEYLASIVQQSSPTLNQGTHTIQGYYRVSGGTGYVNSRVLTVEEK